LPQTRCSQRGFLLFAGSVKIESIETQLNTTGFSPLTPGSGGFMDPQKIVGYFGIGEGMKVADFGSGAGYFTILLGKMVGESGTVTAIDILDSALETLRAKAKAEGLKNVETIRSNLEVPGGSGLASDSQDMVLLANILFQNEDKTLIIAEAKRVLKPNGTLIVIDWRKGTGGFGPPDDLRVGHEELRQIIAGSGFRFSNEIDAGVFHFGMVFKKV
jgi:predicted methyltransferase